MIKISQDYFWAPIFLEKKWTIYLSPSNPPKYPSIAINDDTLSKSHSAFSRYIKDEFLSSYNSVCTTPGCYSCEG